VIGAIVGGASLFVRVPWYTTVIEGGLLATNSLMGFWAYLMLDYTAVLTLPRRVWRWSQALIIALVLYDMVYWRQHYAGVTHLGLQNHPISYIMQGLVPFVVALALAFVKGWMDGKSSFLPTLFYLYVITVLDWLLVLRLHSNGIIDQMGLIILLCNVYIIFIYGMLVKRSVHPSIVALES
jgi:KinB signaling pathway activation protein